jgi:hypothetical protein
VPYELLPRQIARRQRRIRIERAVNLIGRTKCGVAVAARTVGLGSDAMRELYDTLDFRKIPRKRWCTPDLTSASACLLDKNYPATAR